MDLVRLSMAGGVALASLLALASTARQSAAQSPMLELPDGMPSDVIARRIDDAFRPVERASRDSLSGPPAPAPSPAIPLLPQPNSSARWPLSSGSPSSWSAYVDEAAQRFSIPADWVRAVITVESGGRTTLNGQPITSSAGAMGLMQVMPGTFADMSARYGLGADPHNPRANILAGTAYLRAMYDRYGPAHFLAAYNAGPARVDAHLRDGRPLPSETRAYTATLLPRIAFGETAPTVSTPLPVQDLTGRETIGALVHSSSRSTPTRPIDPASASVFAVSAAPRSTPARAADVQPSSRLFITLTAAGRRRGGLTAGSSED